MNPVDEEEGKKKTLIISDISDILNSKMGYNGNVSNELNWIDKETIEKFTAYFELRHPRAELMTRKELEAEVIKLHAAQESETNAVRKNVMIEEFNRVLKIAQRRFPTPGEGTGETTDAQKKIAEDKLAEEKKIAEEKKAAEEKKKKIAEEKKIAETGKNTTEQYVYFKLVDAGTKYDNYILDDGVIVFVEIDGKLYYRKEEKDLKMIEGNIDDIIDGAEGIQVGFSDKFQIVLVVAADESALVRNRSLPTVRLEEKDDGYNKVHKISYNTIPGVSTSSQPNIPIIGHTYVVVHNSGAGFSFHHIPIL